MCRNIKTLFNFEPPVNDDEIRAAALQYVRKVSGFTKPSQANVAAFNAAVEAIAAVTATLLDTLETNAPPKNREDEAARARARDGTDALVGLVETHGRRETEALLEGLEVLPRRRLSYHGVELTEFDLDVTLERRPALVLVDELAHSNAPGSRHAKRWQDVAELLAAGISVYTTLNVQHLESLNDVVAQITGVVVRETVPDAVFERADEVELVDISAEVLLERIPELRGRSEAIARALHDNPGLQAAGQQVRASDRAAAAAFRQHFGDLEAVAWTSRYDDAQLLRPMSQDLLAGGFASLPFAQDQLHYGLTFELPLFVGGKLLALSHLARLKADEAGALLEGTRWQVRANVTTTYATTQVLTAATRAYRDELASLEQTHARVDLMVRQGKRPEVDLLEITDALEEARAQLADARAARTHVRALLLALLDYPPDQIFAFDSLPDRMPALPVTGVDWNALVLDAAPVATAEIRVRQATSGKHAARADFLPRLSVRGNLLENAGSGVPGSQETWELTLQASIPVFTGGRNVAEYQSAAAAERAARLALTQTRPQQQAGLRGGLARLRAAADGLDAAGERGEYHTFVYDGPAFAFPLLLRPGRHMEFDGHRCMDLTLVPPS